MKIRIALFTGLILTLGTAMSAVAINSAPSTKSADAVATITAQQIESAEKVTSQTKPATSRILVLPRPL